MPGISYTTAFILGTFLECVMYGVFITLYIAACYVQWEKWSRGQGLNRFLASATVYFGITVTASLAIPLSVAIRAILYNPQGEAVYLSPVIQTSVKWVTWFMILQFQVAVGDIIIIYRMYHIYDRNLYICIVPSIVNVALLANGVGLAIGFLNPTESSLKSQSAWSTSAFILTIFNTLFLTVAISFRLWRVHRRTAKAGIQAEDSIILRVIRALIESAAFWTTFTLLNFFTSIAKTNLVYTSLSLTSPAVGISFCLIIVRLGRILPEAREESWNMSVRTPIWRSFTTDRLAVSYPQVKIQKDVYVGGPEDFPMGTESQKEGYVDSLSDLPKVYHPSHSPSPPA